MTRAKNPNWTPPLYAEEIDGLLWTPKMVMHFRGLSQSSYYRLREQYSMKAILRSEWLAQMKGKWQRTEKDNSQRFVLGGKEYSMMMLYHIFVAEQFFVDFIPSYAQFVARCKSYQKYGSHATLLDGVYIYSTNIGRADLLSYIAGFSERKYNHIVSNYKGTIDQNRHQDVEIGQADLHVKYLECLWADPKMHGLYYEELIKAHDRYKAEVFKLREQTSVQAITIASLRNDVDELQKQIFKYKTTREEKNVQTTQ